jgi:hypothetical protein
VDGKLHVWSDLSANRYASRLTGTAGEVKQALWQPSADSEFVYEPSERGAVKKMVHAVNTQPLLTLADEGFEPAQVERGFMHWMESRSWTPVAFTPELSLWARKDGALAGAETLRGPDGNLFVRITARRQTSSLTAVLTVDVDPRNWWPKRQSIRFESAGRIVELLLTSNRIQPVASADLSDAVFHPDIAVPGEIPPRVSTLTVPEPPAVEEAPVHELPQGAVQTVEAHYVLHQVGACVGEPVRIEEEAGGVRIYSLGGGSGGLPQTFTGQAFLRDVSGALADLRRPLPVDPGETEARVPAGALRHAWALRSLAVAFPENRVIGLPERPRRQLESMVSDHVLGIRRSLGMDSGGITPAFAGGRLSGGVANWRDQVSNLFNELVRVHNEPASVPASFDEIQTQLNNLAIAFAAESGGTSGVSGP